MVASVNQLESEIRNLIGDNREMVVEFRKVLLDVFRQMESEVVRRNCALREITRNFGVQNWDYAKVVGDLRAGVDTSAIKRFDEMAEYAAREYPDVIGFVSGESSTGSSEEGLARLLREGIKPLPKPSDREVLDATIGYVGNGFFEAFETVDCPEVMDKKAEAAIRRLEVYYEKIASSIEEEKNGAPAIGWPRYRLSRLRNEIGKLPRQYQQTARQRVRLSECEKMVEEHFNPVNVPF